MIESTMATKTFDIRLVLDLLLTNGLLGLAAEGSVQAGVRGDPGVP